MAVEAGFLEERQLSAEELVGLSEAMDADQGETILADVRQLAQLPVWGAWLRVGTNLQGERVRYRVLHGGRGGAKSRTLATELILRGTERVERVLCTREFQKSIRDSVHRLLADEINRLGLGVLGSGFYLVTDKEIRGRNGTLFIFQGLHRNEDGIRSLEGITICWVEEARFVSQDSLDALIPTIRQEGSEIWFSYNPKDADDPVEKMFRGKSGPPPGSVVVEVNYYDNPWFPDVLRQAMEYDRGRDPERYAHIWLGKFLQRSEAKVFRNWKIRPFEVPEDAVQRFGADWGFSVDPTVLVSAFIGRWSGEPWESDPVADPDGNVLFVRHEAWAVGCPIDETPALFAGDDEGQPPGRERWQNPNKRPGVPGAHRWRIRADSARPELIAYLKARGFNIEPAEKGAGSVEEGVTFLQSYDICVHPDCVHVADELTHYSYKLDKLTKQVLPVLADKDNHTIDALRYALEAVRKAGHGVGKFASTGRRATLQPAGEIRQAQEAEIRRATRQETPTPSSSSGGAGWGSAPGLRTGVF